MHGVEAFAVLGALLAAYALVGGVIGRLVPPPLFFAGAGALVAGLVAGGEGDPVDLVSQDLIVIALSILLFVDATSLDLRASLARRGMELRLLLLVLPLTVVAAALAGWWLFPALGAAELVLLAGILGPTDAALVDPVIHDERVDARLREAVNVEAGLNDGLATPIIAVAAASAGLVTTLHAPESGAEAIVDVIGGVLVGLACGWAFAALSRAAERAGWASTRWETISLIGLACLTYVLAELLGVIALVAVFVAGAAIGTFAPALCRRSLDFAERVGQVLSALVFCWFGLVAVHVLSGQLSWQAVAFGLFVLVVARPATTWLATIGEGLAPRQRLFLGWYGPRGLASVLFLALVLDGDPRLPPAISLAVVTTVALSLVLHGITSALAPRLAPATAAGAGTGASEAG